MGKIKFELYKTYLRTQTDGGLVVMISFTGQTIDFIMLGDLDLGLTDTIYLENIKLTINMTTYTLAQIIEQADEHLGDILEEARLEDEAEKAHNRAESDMSRYV